MKKNRICTTISSKHWALLNKHAEKYGTQQKALEHALESLENDIKRGPPLSPEEELWARIGKELVKITCLVQKDALKELFKTSDVERMGEYFARETPGEFLVEYYYQKPLKECSLKEILTGTVVFGKVSGWFDTICYTDDGDHYTLNATHCLGINMSKTFIAMQKNLYKTYGAKTECRLSERSFFIKIFKNFNEHI